MRPTPVADAAGILEGVAVVVVCLMVEVGWEVNQG